MQSSVVRSAAIQRRQCVVDQREESPAIKPKASDQQRPWKRAVAEEPGSLVNRLRYMCEAGPMGRNDPNQHNAKKTAELRAPATATRTTPSFIFVWSDMEHIHPLNLERPICCTPMRH